jgi:hypothetical protein
MIDWSYPGIFSFNYCVVRWAWSSGVRRSINLEKWGYKMNFISYFAKKKGLQILKSVTL